MGTRQIPGNREDLYTMDDYRTLGYIIVDLQPVLDLHMTDNRQRVSDRL